MADTHRPALITQSRSKDEHYDRLADWFEQHADRELFEKLYLA